MDKAALLKDLRRGLQDEISPYLWQDEELLSYLNEAQDEFCRETGGIADARSDFLHIVVDAGTEWVDIDPRILKIRSAEFVEDGGRRYKLELMNMEDVEQMRCPHTPGLPIGLVLGESEDAARITYIPMVAGELRLVVYRLPLESLLEATVEPEIAIEHRPTLLYFAKYKAFMKPDAESFDKDSADANLQLFTVNCNRARREKERMKHRYRTVRYGGV